jgi:hypothetical protein
MPRLRLIAAIMLTCSIGLFALVSVSHATAGPRTFTIGITDPVYFGSHRGVWLRRTVSFGAQFVLLPVTWASVAPQRPAAGTDPSDPANPAYNWGSLDATVRAVVAEGLTAMFVVERAPPWAEGRHRPRQATPGSWRPNATAYGAFAKAVARRYSGSFDPGNGVLPRVRYFQGWAEPNLAINLSPQWVRRDKRWVAESPIILRGLLNAFYAGVKAVNSSDVVVTGGTAPYGDPPGGARMRPALFVRNLLCLSGSLAPVHCPDPAHFDILGHDPYSFAGPLLHAYWADDVTLPDMGKLTRAVAAAERAGTALPRIHHRVWATEFGWNSRPPDRTGVPLLERARWIEQAFYVLWRQGIDTATWYLIVDQSFTFSHTATWQTGLYYANGRLKPDGEAFRFPFLAQRERHGRVMVWGVAPRAGIALVQVRTTAGWSTVARQRCDAHQVIDATIPLAGRPAVRSVIGGEASMEWQL